MRGSVEVLSLFVLKLVCVVAVWIVLPLPCRESMNSRALSENRLDQIEGGAAAGGGPDYKNLQYNEDGSLNMDGEDVLAASFGDQIKLLGNSSSAPSYENTRILGISGGQLEGGESDDYMNDSPEGWGHIYSNQEDLLLQVCLWVWLGVVGGGGGGGGAA